MDGGWGAKRRKLAHLLNDRLTECFSAADNCDSGGERQRLVKHVLPEIECDLNSLQEWARSGKENRFARAMSSNDGWCGKSVSSCVVGGEQEEVAWSADCRESAEQPSEPQPKRAKDELASIAHSITPAEQQLKVIGRNMRQAVRTGFPGYNNFVKKQHTELRTLRSVLDKALEDIDSQPKCDRKRELSHRIDIYIKECDEMDKHLSSLPSLFRLLRLSDATPKTTNAVACPRI